MLVRVRPGAPFFCIDFLAALSPSNISRTSQGPMTKTKSTAIRAQIRNGRSDDIDQIASIAHGLKDWFTEDGVAEIQKDLAFQRFLVAVYDSRIVGFISFYAQNGIGHIGWMAVQEELHRQGIGRSLLRELSLVLKKHSIEELRVANLDRSESSRSALESMLAGGLTLIRIPYLRSTTRIKFSISRPEQRNSA